MLGEWGEYRAWLIDICGMCGRLSDCVSSERAAEIITRGRQDTPTLFQAGRAAFRSQVGLFLGFRIYRSGFMSGEEALLNGHHTSENCRTFCQIVDRASNVTDISNAGEKVGCSGNFIGDM